MPNTCQIIITRGKNKGMACCEVNRKCRHKNIECPHCGVHFTVETSYSRHMTTCKGGDKQRVEPIRRMRARNESDTRNAKSPARSSVTPTELMQKIEKLEKELEQVKNKPTTVNHWSIVIGGNFYDELVSKMGQDDTVHFLTSIADTKTPLDVISKLYLEGNAPDDYPIACRNHDHFRYINSDHRIVDDKGGHNISKIVRSGVHDALIHAANAAIREQVSTESYDKFDLCKLQDFIADMRNHVSGDRIISELSRVTSIPNHPFFSASVDNASNLDDSSATRLS